MQLTQARELRTIRTLQQSVATDGRIRIGSSVPKISSKGNAFNEPLRLDSFAFTSVHRDLVERIAAMYGGKVEPWSPQRSTEQQWRVVTTSREIHVIVPPIADVLSQFYEQWAGGMCTVRCDGVRDLISLKDCACGPADEDRPAPRACKPTTRVNVMLYDPASGEMISFGVWRLETHGYYAATQLPGQVEIMQAIGTKWASLRMVEQSKVLLIKGKPTATKWWVPQLLPVTGTAAQITGTAGPLAISAGPSAPVEAPDDDATVDDEIVDDVMPVAPPAAATAGPTPQNPVTSKPLPGWYLAAIARATDDADLRDIFRELAGNAERGGFDLSVGAWAPVMPALLARKAELEALAKPAAPAPTTPPELPPLPAEPVQRDTDEVEALWMQCVTRAGQRGWGSDDLIKNFRDFAKKAPDTGTADDYRRFLAGPLSN